MASVVHDGVNCDQCGTGPIQGVRYRCSFCANYDLCEACYSSRTHDATHLFLRIDMPSFGSFPVVANRSTVQHHIRCDVCGVVPLQGYRYVCAVCLLDLCEACESKGWHDPNHTRIKTADPTSKLAQDEVFDAASQATMAISRKAAGYSAASLPHGENPKPTRFDIGEWRAAAPMNQHEDLYWSIRAEELLQDSCLSKAKALPTSAVVEIIRGVCDLQPAEAAYHTSAGTPNAAVSLVHGALSPDNCESMMLHIDRVLAARCAADSTAASVRAAARDLKVELGEAEATTLIGVEALDLLISAGRQMLERVDVGGIGRAPRSHVVHRLRLVLRRREALPGTECEIIPFHFDVSRVVVNVALNKGFVGARLVYALSDGQLFIPTRDTGDATVHDCTVVHGVSRLAKGVRYNFYVVFEMPPTSSAA